MNPIPFSSIRFGWRDHFSALWWLGLLYRRPKHFWAAFFACSVKQRLVAAFWLVVHLAPYLVAISVSVRLFMVSQIGREFGIEFLIIGLVIGFPIGLGILRYFWYGVGPDVGSGAGFPIRLGIMLGVGLVLGLLTLGPPFGKATHISLFNFIRLVTGLVTGLVIGFGIVLGGGLEIGLVFGLVSGFVCGLVIVSLRGLAIGLVVGFGVGLVSGLSVFVSLTRIFYHLAHPLFVWPHLHGRWYPHHPVAWDDLCAVAFPSLDRLLVDYAEKAPESGVAEIERLISSYPSQRVMALRARVTLVARQSGKTANLAILDEILAALPEGGNDFLAETRQVRMAVHDIVSYQIRLNTNNRPFFREPYARLVFKEIQNFQHRIEGFAEPLATEFRAASNQWFKIAEKQLHEAQAVAEKKPAPQVFRSSGAVDREKEAFVPRDSIVGDLEKQVLLSTGCPGVVLYGRRRVGKTTVLRNLSGFLPSTVHIVNISMMNPQAYTSLSLLVDYLVREVSTVFGMPSRIAKDLSDLFGFLSECNQSLERDDRRLVISVDEYEDIDQQIGKGAFPDRLLATFRQSMESHRRITWIFAGSHEITELVNAPWTSYLVSARTVEVPLFSDKETRLLLTEPLKYSSLWRDDNPNRPRPGFESGFWGEGGIERIHAEAGGWPHLVQLIAETIVNILNNESGRQVTSLLIERALDKAIVIGHNVLHELLRSESGLPGEWEYLSIFRIRETQPPPDDEAIARSLRRRLLVEEESGQWRLRVPLMSRWLRKQA